jgi:hypothetical protein
MKPMLKAPGTQRLKLRYDETPFNFAFKLNLRRYTAGSKEANNYAVASLLTALARVVAAGAWPAADAVSRAVVGWCRLTL